MQSQVDVSQGTSAGTRRRLLGLEPVFEGGWFHKGARAHDWDVEDTLTSIALFGDVTVDLSETKSTPDEVTLHAWAILRDVEVTVPEGTRVELTGGGLRGHLTSHVAAISDASCTRVVRIDGHTVVGDVTVRQVRSTL